MDLSTSSSRFSKEEHEEEEEEEEEASPREISFMTASKAAAAATNTAAASSSSPSASAGLVLRSSDGAGASGCGGGGGGSNHDVEVIEKEHMFDKVVTPSDVGKLNRLVIPKQHAEKYFPLDAAANEKGLLLSFEDRAGKLWRFRYSYWNSSQSYVMTKGWSRFVKEKRLDAGDTVSFGRGVGDHARGRLFIDWRRRPDPPAPYHRPLPSVPFAPWPHAHYPPAGIGGASSRTVLHLPPSPSSPYDSHHRRHDNAYGPSTRQLLFYAHHQATVVLESVPVRTPPERAEPLSSGSKRLRLFGVNLDCTISEEENGGKKSAPPQLPSSPSSSSGEANRCTFNLNW